MGTRHIQTVINKKGEIKVRQYGQWDGAPDGQGLDILEFLRDADLDKYQENLDKIIPLTKERIEQLNGTEWHESHPHLSRDCGAEIHKMIEEGQVEEVLIEPGNADQFCVGFFTIDFKENVYRVEYLDFDQSFYLDDLPTKEAFLLIFSNEEL